MAPPFNSLVLSTSLILAAIVCPAKGWTARAAEPGDSSARAIGTSAVRANSTESAEKTAGRELHLLKACVPQFHATELPATADTVRLKPEQALTIEQSLWRRAGF